jgi:hypothetical protein
VGVLLLDFTTRLDDWPRESLSEALDGDDTEDPSEDPDIDANPLGILFKATAFSLTLFSEVSLPLLLPLPLETVD